MDAPVGDTTLNDDEDTYYEWSDSHNSPTASEVDITDMEADNNDNDNNNNDDATNSTDDHLLGAVGGTIPPQPLNTNTNYDHASDELVRSFHDSCYGNPDLIKRFLCHVSAALADSDGYLKELTMSFDSLSGSYSVYLYHPTLLLSSHSFSLSLFLCFLILDFYTGTLSYGINHSSAPKVFYPALLTGITKDRFDELHAYISFRGQFCAWRMEYLGAVQSYPEILASLNAR